MGRAVSFGSPDGAGLRDFKTAPLANGDTFAGKLRKHENGSTLWSAWSRYCVVAVRYHGGHTGMRGSEDRERE